MAKKFEEPQGRGDFFKSLGTLFGGFVADKIEEAVTKVSPKQLRPPGALDEFAFLTTCTRCDQCIEACPQDALVKAGPSAGLGLHAPVLEPRRMACFLCSELPCITACPEGALVWPARKLEDGTALEGPAAVRIGTAKVKEKRCLTYATDDREALPCTVCVDRCPYPGEAIRMVKAESGPDHPEVLEDRCTGCGLCTFGCPAPEAAIVVEPRR
jgi:MauM/NapG family ferredoxin protein